MIMRIKLACPCCTAKVFAAVGAFVGHDEGPSTVRSVDAFHSNDDETVGAVVSWDVHPTRPQINEFRRIWDEMTDMRDVVIMHDAPSSIVDKPSVAAWN